MLADPGEPGLGGLAGPAGRQRGGTAGRRPGAGRPAAPGRLPGGRALLVGVRGGRRKPPGRLLPVVLAPVPGEPGDARFWRVQAESLAELPQPAWRLASPDRPLVPRGVRAEILALCKQGMVPRLPPRLAAVLKSLPVEDDDGDWPEIPHWSPDVVHRLRTAAEEPPR
ncbi:hypothetical protein KCH_13000 [Kitasatospora cheerisanensis KCTC 2395]|uniref:Uncharacterized protein n=1 Tax=Kitasatospora cheerisanensis KCTC 2395 TaxID=1348663 RepID=A0A066Z3N4_9ACTN|nr:hypothetical protein KCH_13000 [Kitasatospora cheerisanensis KCTC 2395]